MSSLSGPRELDRAARQRPKRTYYARKDEIAALEAEADVLGNKIQLLKAERSDVVDLLESFKRNAQLRLSLQTNSWMMAEAQSAVHNVNRMVMSLLESYIHLTAEPDQRLHSLISLRDEKLRLGREFLLRRARHVDLSRFHRQVESSEDSNGDVFVEQFWVLPFPEAPDVKPLYDALILALTNQQFLTWEKLGITSVCASEETMDECASQQRYFSMVAPGVDMEKNTALFRRYFDLLTSSTSRTASQSSTLWMKTSSIHTILSVCGWASSALTWSSLTRSVERMPSSSLVVRGRTARAQEEAVGRHYKSTYYARKNEIAELEEEAKELVKEIQRLQANQGDASGLLASLQQNAALWSSLQVTSLIIAEAQSALADSMPTNPLHTFIRLSADAASRERTLRAIRDAKLHVATEFLLRRTRFMDLSRSHRQVESSEAPNGDIFVDEFIVAPFPDVTSVKEVYEALRLVISHHQFVSWEQLGMTTICELEGAMEGAESLLRYFTTVLPGIDMEKNSASFWQYYDHSDLVDGPYGLSVIDSVEEDELYPYHPDSRLRLDMSGVTMVRQIGSTVSMVRWSRSRIHRPRNDVAPQTVAWLCDCVPRWTEATIKTARDYLKPVKTCKNSLCVDCVVGKCT
ncbi:hypothetical protein Poli38472_012204 [Pythium oligandrum]|uniref:Uncharacterized protein n=1 Tax=Pythium oligandrum TaxID=41045 RepID=A0A8K1CRN8_PYTOL|nr:hypothetical protein Poli38472_012204 [Pythium oligandrum]|eukprot:TMW67088.1 hypothetical protein Poli38472_012204 [Pythium oligandrum]